MDEATKALRFEEALLDPACVHTRSKTVCGKEVIAVYHRDTTSPSGVIRAWGTDKVSGERIIGRLQQEGRLPSRLSPLSPTEGLFTC